MPTLKDKVNLLDAAVLTNNVQDVRELFAKYHYFEFTSRAIGLAMRFCGVDMVAALIENGATLSFTPTEKLHRAYLYRWPRYWGGHCYDFAKYLFPAIPVPDDTEERVPVSAEKRQAIIEYLVSRNIPELPGFLYYSILGNDSGVYDYLRANNFTRLLSPYMEIVEGLLSLDEINRLDANDILKELERRMEKANDAQLVVMLEHLSACVPRNISVTRYDLLPFKRMCTGDVFLLLAEHADLTRKYNHWELIRQIIADSNMGGLEYAISHKWVKTRNQLEYLLELARKASPPSPEMIAYLVQVNEDGNAKGTKTKKGVTDEFSLDSTPERLTLGEVKQNWGIRKIGDGAYEIYSYKGQDANVVVPEAVSKGFVTCIAAETFNPYARGITNKLSDTRKAIESVEFPGTIQTFGNCLFTTFNTENKLRRVVLHDGIREIGDSAFSRCKNLADVSLPTTLVSIGNHTFYGCEALQAIYLPDALEKIGSGAFECTGLRHISFPPNLRSIDASAFKRCDPLTSATFNTGLGFIGAQAFERTALQDITLPSTLDVVADHAFYECSSLQTVRFADDKSASPLRIGESAFEKDTSLSTVVFAPNLDAIGKRAFAGCPIESIVIPEGTKSIEEEAFMDCKKLQSVQVPSDTKLGFQAFSGCDALADQNGAIVVNQTLFGVPDPQSISAYLTPLKLDSSITAIGTTVSLLPQIVYRPDKTAPTPPDLEALKIGASFSLGRFPIQKSFYTQDLSWIVLTVERKKALLITSRAIMARMYPPAMDTDWTTSTARRLLNGAFMDVAFTPEERALIAPTNTAPRGESVTEDHVFLLSSLEVQKYLKNQAFLVASATPYARAQQKPPRWSRRHRDEVGWILRAQRRDAPFINAFGSIDDADSLWDCDSLFFRPAMWIRLSK